MRSFKEQKYIVESMFHLIMATPQQIIYDNKILSIIIPGTSGYMQILSKHAPLITSLKSGTVKLVTENQEQLIYTISGGFFEVSNNHAQLLIDP